MPNHSLIILGALEMSVKHTWGAINVRSSACTAGGHGHGQVRKCGTRMTTRLCHAANDARLTMRRHCDQTHPASEAVGLCAAVTSHTSGVCPRLLKGHVPSPGTRIPVSDLASGTYYPSLISTKPSFCALSPIGVNRGYVWDAQRLLGTRIPGWTFPVVAMTAEPKPHNSTVF